MAFGAVLLVVLALLLLGSREEITRVFGLGGEQGTLTIESCGRPRVVVDEQRSVCTGVFRPDDGGEPYAVEALLTGDPGDSVRVAADGRDEPAYRADVWGKLGAVALPLFPIGLLWLVPALWLVSRTPGAIDRGRSIRFLFFSVIPTALILSLGVVAFLVALLTT
jgi:hypothetical protein